MLLQSFSSRIFDGWANGLGLCVIFFYQWWARDISSRDNQQVLAGRDGTTEKGMLGDTGWVSDHGLRAEW